jgi:hypothetical protein
MAELGPADARAAAADDDWGDGADGGGAEQKMFDGDGPAPMDDDGWGAGGGDDGDWGPNPRGEWSDEPNPTVSAEMAEWEHYHELRRRWKAKEEELRRALVLDGEKAAKQMFSQEATSLLVFNALENMMKHGRIDGFDVSAVNDDAFTWCVRMSGFAADSALATDLALLESKHGYGYVEVEVRAASVAQRSPVHSPTAPRACDGERGSGSRGRRACRCRR